MSDLAAGGARVAHKLAILQTARDLRKDDPTRAAHFDFLDDGLRRPYRW